MKARFVKLLQIHKEIVKENAQKEKEWKERKESK